MKYKVITLAICVKNNRIAKHGEVIDDSELTINARELVDTRAIELIDAPAEKVADVASSATENVESTTTEANTENVEAPVVEATTADVEATTDAKPKAKTAAEKVADANA